jgi:hypothetical protein
MVLQYVTDHLILLVANKSLSFLDRINSTTEGNTPWRGQIKQEVLYSGTICSYNSAIFMKCLVTAVKIGYLAYGTFQHKLVFFGVAKIGPKKAYLIMLTPYYI